MTIKFNIHDTKTAPKNAVGVLASSEKRYGRIPNLYGALAEAPIAVEAYDMLGKLLMRSSFSPTERHVVWFAINAYHGCNYCMSAHTVLAKGEDVAEDVIETARSMRPYRDPRLETLRKFTLELVENRGWISDDKLAEFIESGFTKQNVLEIIVVVSHKVLSNYTNHIVNTPLDDVFTPYAWQKPELKVA